MDTKMSSLNNEWFIGNVLVCAHFSAKLPHNTLFMLHYAVIYTFRDIFDCFNAQTVLWLLYTHNFNIYQKWSTKDI